MIVSKQLTVALFVLDRLIVLHTVHFLKTRRGCTASAKQIQKYFERNPELTAVSNNRLRKIIDISKLGYVQQNFCVTLEKFDLSFMRNYIILADNVSIGPRRRQPPLKPGGMKLENEKLCIHAVPCSVAPYTLTVNLGGPNLLDIHMPDPIPFSKFKRFQKFLIPHASFF